MDDHRLPLLLCEPELPVEHAPLRVTRRVVAIEVEPDLADGDDAVVEQAVDRFTVGSLMRVDPGCDRDTRLRLRDRQRSERRRDTRPDRDDAFDACGPR